MQDGYTLETQMRQPSVVVHKFVAGPKLTATVDDNFYDPMKKISEPIVTQSENVVINEPIEYSNPFKD